MSSSTNTSWYSRSRSSWTGVRWTVRAERLTPNAEDAATPRAASLWRRVILWTIRALDPEAEPPQCIRSGDSWQDRLLGEIVR